MPLTIFGLNFSHRRAAELELDPREAFYATVIHLKPRLLRLSLYWDQISPEAGQYDFDTIRWYLDQAERHDCHVLLTVGFKPQRHPSFFPPSWLRANSAADGGGSPDEGRLAAHLLMMLERAVALLADYDAIDAWEVEHLPFLPEARRRSKARQESQTERPASWSVPPALTLREIAVLHEVDPRHRPVVVSHPASRFFDHGWRTILATADVFGWDLSGTLPGGGEPLGVLKRARLDYLAARLRLQAALASRAGRPCWITELPVEPSPTRGPASRYAAEEAVAAIDLARRSHVGRIYVRGAEWWLLKRDQGEPRWWDLARSLLRPLEVPPE